MRGQIRDLWGCSQLHDLLPQKERPRTVNEATPDDVAKRACSEVARLQREIESLQQRLKKANADLKFWEAVPSAS